MTVLVLRGRLLLHRLHYRWQAQVGSVAGTPMVAGSHVDVAFADSSAAPLALLGSAKVAGSNPPPSLVTPPGNVHATLSLLALQAVSGASLAKTESKTDGEAVVPANTSATPHLGALATC